LCVWQWESRRVRQWETVGERQSRVGLSQTAHRLPAPHAGGANTAHNALGTHWAQTQAQTLGTDACASQLPNCETAQLSNLPNLPNYIASA